MKAPIVHSNAPITLLGGGEVRREDLQQALALAPYLVAADGGADTSLAMGHVPDAVFGDFDSLSDDARAAIPDDRLHQISEQDSTDFDKALRSVAAPVVLGVGFLGGRLDHQLAGLHTLVQSGRSPCILIGATELLFHVPSHLCLPTRAGDVVSLFSLRRMTARATGLEWAIDDLIFDPMAQIGTSNCATGEITLGVDGPGMLGIVPRRLLRDLAQALGQA